MSGPSLPPTPPDAPLGDVVATALIDAGAGFNSYGRRQADRSDHDELAAEVLFALGLDPSLSLGELQRLLRIANAVLNSAAGEAS